jgi:rare lipoprotein A
VASYLAIAPGTCANNAAPMGTVITVTNGTGVSIQCRVVSRGPFVTGRVVDLAEATFSHLGSLSRGLVSVTVTW